MNRRRLLILGFTLALVSGLFVQRVHAESIVEQIGCDVTTIENGVVTVNRACQITDFINLFIYLSKWGMSILAFLAVGMLVYGGFQFVTAAGRSSKVDEGKRVIAGTVIGVVISLTAYIIVNAAVTAVTGNTLRVRSGNFLSVIGAVFAGPNGENVRETIQNQTVPITKPFSDPTSGSGTGAGGSGDQLSACRTSPDWNQGCAVGSSSAIEMYCSDAANVTSIATLQQALNDKGCECGNADGCFGVATTSCVRRFQIANGLTVTGTINATTKDRIENGNTNCSAEASAIAAQLPAPVERKPTASGNGCCIVGSGTASYYCLDNVSAQACAGSGSDSEFISGTGSCVSNPATRGRCGYCTNTFPPTTADTQVKCANNVTSYWCTQVVQNARNQSVTPTFVPDSSCNGACASCATTMVNSL